MTEKADNIFGPSANSLKLIPFSSWPGLSRPSTSLLRLESKDVDARHKAGHDELDWILNAQLRAAPPCLARL
jgi:hypothetical protein